MNIDDFQAILKSAYTHLFPLQLAIPASLINQALAKAITDEKQLKRLMLEFSPRFITLHLGVQLKYIAVQFKVKFALHSFEISRHKQAIVLRRVDDIELSSGGILSRGLLGLIKKIVHIFTGKTLIELGLKEVDLIRIEKDLLTLDFKEAQLFDRMKEALTENLHPLAATMVRTLIHHLLQLIGQHFAITDLKSNANGLLVQIVRLTDSPSNELDFSSYASEI